MQQFNVAEAKARFSQLIQKALAGEDVVIAKDNKPLVKLVPLKRAARRRQPHARSRRGSRSSAQARARST